MTYLLWNPLSINYLIESILASVIAGYFLHRLFSQQENWQTTRSTLFAAVTFVSAALGTLGQMFSISLHPSLGNLVLPWVGPFGASAMGGFLLFAYFFHGRHGLGKWGGRVLSSVLLAVIGLEIWIALERHQLLQSGIVEYRQAWVDIPTASGFFISFVFFGMHLFQSLSGEMKLRPLLALKHTVAAIAWPPAKLPREAAAARAFLYVAAIPLALGLCLLMRSYGLIGWRDAEILSCWLFLATLAAFALTYLNYVPEQSSLRVKVVGITLTTLLSILCGISWFVATAYIESFRSPYLPKIHSAIRFAPQSHSGYLVEKTEFSFDADLGTKIAADMTAVDLSYTVPFFGEPYSKLHVQRAGIIGFDHAALWRDVGYRFGPQPAIFALATDLDETSHSSSGLFVRRDLDRVVLTWNNLVSRHRAGDVYSFQVRLFRNGTIELAYKDLPDRFRPDIYLTNLTPSLVGIVPGYENRIVNEIRFAQQLPFAANAMQGIIEHHRLDFLRYLDRVYAPIAAFILFSSFAVMVVFPRFFQVNLDRPLRRLIDAVQHIMDGKLATTVEVTHRDEIGYLAKSFGSMATKQRDLILELEDKVAKRTVEASDYAVKNARLQERNHLSRELHDAVSQTLFSANLIAGTLPELMQSDPQKGAQALGEIQRLNRDALAEMRKLLLELRPEKLTSVPLGSLLRSLKTDIESRFFIPITLLVETDAVLPEDVQVTFYRIAQESLTNAAKHANADSITVTFDGMAEQALLSISDNGQGFDPSQNKRGHFGLGIMQERIQGIGGSLEITSHPKEGTLITAIWFAHQGSARAAQ